jgi:hypothetical protein
MLRIVNRSSDARPAYAAVAAGAAGASTAARAARRRHDASPPCPRSRRRLAPTVLARAFAWGILFAAVASPAGAVLLDFEGVGGQLHVGRFYGGGGGGPAKDYGIVFGDGAFGAVDTDAGGSFTIANEPSPSTALFLNGNQAQFFLTVLRGFTALSFQYTSLQDASVTVYDGPNVTGTALVASNLPAVGMCPSDCGDPTGQFGVWRNFTVAPFSGVARSASFSTANNIFFVDDMVIELVPTQAPTKVPTQAPTKFPTKAPTKIPTQAPTKVPTQAPTKVPTRRPTMAPTKRPTRFPTAPPTRRCHGRGMKGTKRCMKG